MPNPRVDAKPKLDILDPRFIPHVLKEGELGAVFEWCIRNPKGEILQHKIQKSESFVQQFLQLLFVQAAFLPSTGPLSVIDTGNTARNVYTPFTNNYCLDVNAGAATTTYGIVVGTGVGAPTITDYQLVTQIVHGAAGGQMQYGGTSFGIPGSDATTSQLTITRNFTANAGGITVNEVGLYCRGYDGAPRYFCIIRDSTAGGLAIVVAAGNTLTINYRPQAVV